MDDELENAKSSSREVPRANMVTAFRDLQCEVGVFVAGKGSIQRYSTGSGHV